MENEKMTRAFVLCKNAFSQRRRISGLDCFQFRQQIHFEGAFDTMTTNEKREEPAETSEIVEESNRNIDSEEFQEFMNKVTQKCQVNLF
jgi:hypothetical protein